MGFHGRENSHAPAATVLLHGGLHPLLDGTRVGTDGGLCRFQFLFLRISAHDANCNIRINMACSTELGAPQDVSECFPSEPPEDVFIEEAWGLYVFPPTGHAADLLARGIHPQPLGATSRTTLRELPPAGHHFGKSEAP